MSSYQYQIFNITQHTMSNDLNNLMYMRKYGSLEKNSMPPWIEQKPGGALASPWSKKREVPWLWWQFVNLVMDG